MESMRLQLAGIALGLTLAAGMVGTWIDASAAATAGEGQVLPKASQVVEVYGPVSQALQDGIVYWNGLAGETILRHHKGVAPEGNVVTVAVADLAAPLAGWAAGNPGQGPMHVTVDVDAADDWTVWAHELGHALGLADHNTGSEVGVADVSYQGVMSYEMLGFVPDISDDAGLLRGSWLFDTVSIGDALTIERGSDD